MGLKGHTFRVTLILIALATVGRTRGAQFTRRLNGDPAHQYAYPLHYRTTDQWRRQAADFNRAKASAAALFAGADRVESFRLFPVNSPPEKPGGNLLGDVPWFGRSTRQGRSFAARVGALVLDPNSYLQPGHTVKKCYFDPGVGFRVWKGRQFADVVICFHCNELAVLENSPHVPEQTFGGRVIGRFAVGGDFDPVRPQLAALAKEALPGIPEIDRLDKSTVQSR